MVIHTRVATLVAAAALLVGVSATTGAVAGSLVTSRDIKDGTIQSQDLDPQVRASLHRGATALRSVPRNSVTSATVRDGSLRLRDLVAASHTQGFEVQTFQGGTCSVLPTVSTGHPTSGAVVLAQTNLGSDFTISGQPDPTSKTAIDLTVCNNGETAYNVDGAAGESFSWELIER